MLGHAPRTMACLRPAGSARFYPSCTVLRQDGLTSAVRAFRRQTGRDGLAGRRRCFASISSSVGPIDRERRFGQPLPETHPHLVAPGDLTFGISALEYAQRRARLAARLPTGAVAVIAAAPVQYRSSAVFHPFCQDSDFLYLTGFLEPEALAVIESTGTGGENKFHLFVRPKDVEAERWEGSRSGLQAALDVFNADETGDIGRVDRLIEMVLHHATAVYSDIPTLTVPRSPLMRLLAGTDHRQAVGLFTHLPEPVVPLRPVMNQLRIIKTDAEVAVMRAAGQMSGRAITDNIPSRPTTERQLAAGLESAMLRHGLDRIAYVPVVAGGSNGLAVHYVSNNDRLAANQMVLVDAGGEMGGYAADITRTWPLSGKFSAAQKDLYSVVLDVQRRCVSRCRADLGLSLDDLHREAEAGLADGLSQIGFGRLDGRDIRQLYSHHIGHYLGLDVHDCPGFSRHDQLEANMVVTIEPGVRVPNNDRWPKKFRGMAVQIEDDVCVRSDGPYVLSTEAVKEIVDIENLAW